MSHIYKTSPLYQGLLLVCMAFAIWFGIFNLYDNNSHSRGLSISIFFACIATLPIFLNLLADKIFLSTDAIERRNLFQQRRLTRDNIEGWGVIEHKGKNGSSYSLEIYPKNKSRDKVIKVSSAIKIDKHFKDWITAFPNLTTNPLLRRINNSPKLAAKFATPEGQQKLEQLKKIKFFTSPEKLVEKYFSQWKL